MKLSQRILSEMFTVLQNGAIGDPRESLSWLRGMAAEGLIDLRLVLDAQQDTISLTAVVTNAGLQWDIEQDDED